MLYLHYKLSLRLSYITCLWVSDLHECFAPKIQSERKTRLENEIMLLCAVIFRIYKLLSLFSKYLHAKGLASWLFKIYIMSISVPTTISKLYPLMVTFALSFVHPCLQNWAINGQALCILKYKEINVSVSGYTMV